MFFSTDSPTVKSYHCGRTKATAIAVEMAKTIKEEIVIEMKNGPFSIATDGSNDSKEKQFPLVVSTICPDGVRISLLSVPVLSVAGTGKYCHLN